MILSFCFPCFVHGQNDSIVYPAELAEAWQPVLKGKKIAYCGIASSVTGQGHSLDLLIDGGADIVKIFPAGWLGLSYLKDIKGPINHVKFLAAAGVNEENFKEYLNAGYCAAGISGRFIDRKVIAEGNFEELTRRARIFTDIANAC